MQTKLFEIRDAATFIPAIATQLYVAPGCKEPARKEAENYLLRRAGYGLDKLILFARLDGGGPATYDCYDWKTRTMQVAHDYIEKHWDELESGAVIDVQFIVGETAVAKQSEAL